MSRGEVGLELRVLALLVELEPEAEARQRRAQLVRRVGEQHAMGADQLLDAGGGAVEARGEARHLVAALDLDARGELAGAERLDAGLQPLEPARQAAHHRIGADRDRERDAAEKQHQPDGRIGVADRRPRHDPAPVRQVEAPGRTARPHQPAAGVEAPRRRRQRLAELGDRAQLRVEQREIDAQPARQPFDRGLLGGLRRVRAGGSAAAASSPAISNACATGMRSPPSRQMPPATSTTSSRLAMMVR